MIMAEALFRLTDTESSSSDQSDVNEYGLAIDVIREEQIEEDGQEASCDVCLLHNLIDFSRHVAFYLCYLCEQYLCDKCFKGHKSHKYIKLVSEKSERDGEIETFLDQMRKECEREKRFEEKNVTLVDRVNVEHGLDHKDCAIYGLCGLNNTRWVVSDYNNYCIKLFNVGSNLLQQCIRLGSQPWDVTEIKIKRKPTEQDIMSTSEISATNQIEPDKRCLLAVTLPRKRRILFIDVTQNPTEFTKNIKTEKKCCSIDFSGDNIFTVCYDGESNHVGSWFVSVMSTDGVTIQTIKTDLRPWGISVDPDTNHVYVCSQLDDTLYRLNSSLENLEPIFDFKLINSEWPRALCLHRDKLYVGHGRLSTHGNFVTVVRDL